jgi:hypothetical protein
MNDQTTADQMRLAAAQFIAAVHSSYVREAAVLSPAARARLPLFSAGPFSVAAVGTRYLHVVATGDELAPPEGADASIQDSRAPLSWVVRFYDPVVLTGLEDLDETVEPAILGVRRALGVGTVLYHFTIGGGATLDPHRAVHVAARLFSAHRAAADELDAIRRLVPGHEDLVDEMAAAASAGLVRAHALLACAVAPGEHELIELCAQTAPEPAQVRRALTAALRRRAQARRA